MSIAALRPCTYPGCAALVADGRCVQHRAVVRKQSRERTPNLYGRKWQQYRLHYLRAHSLCVHCAQRGVLTPANEVDHITPHRGDMRLFWNHDNHQALCHSCHSTKTARYDGGFGRITDGKDPDRLHACLDLDCTGRVLRPGR